MNKLIQDISEKILHSLDYESAKLKRNLKKLSEEYNREISKFEIDSLIAKLTKERKRTKRRFITNFTKAYRNYLASDEKIIDSKDISFINEYISKKNEVGEEAAKLFLEEYIDGFEEWVDDISKGISTFPHLLDMPPKSINSAIIKDIKFEYLTGKNKKREVYEQPNSIDGPTFTDTKLAFKGTLSDVVESGENKKVLRSEQVFEEKDSEPYSVYIDLDVEGLRLIDGVSKKITHLDAVDYSIFTQCLMFKAKTSTWDLNYKKVSVNIRDIAENVYSSKLNTYLNQIAQRLHKLALYKYTIVSGPYSHTFGIFDDVYVDTDTWMADIEISSAIVDDYINGRTTKVYHDLLPHLSQLSRNILLALQRERHKYPKANGEITITMHYTSLIKYSVKVARLRYVSEKIKALRDAFDSIKALDKDKQDILYDYVFDPNLLTFTITLYPLSKEDFYLLA